MTSYDPSFDSHRLMYHPEEVAAWLRDGVTRGPIYTEMTLSGRCNCRCIFCGLDYRVGQYGDMAVEDARRIIRELHEIGNKSIMLSGEGEPLLHPDARDLISFASGIMDTSITTNGIALDEEKVPLIDGLKWIRFSINAGNAETYAKVHGTSTSTFDRVLANIERAVDRKRSRKLTAVIGTQLVLLDDNADTVLDLARTVKALGVDYFSVKPYSQHPLSENRQSVDYAGFDALDRELRELENDTFKIICRTHSMQKVGAAKPYGKCHGTHFLCHISANGDVWECIVFVGDPRFRIGNAMEESMRDIWEGERRREVLHFIDHDMDLRGCRDICRLDECNRYLWRLKHPREHDNFI